MRWSLAGNSVAGNFKHEENLTAKVWIKNVSRRVGSRESEFLQRRRNSIERRKKDNCRICHYTKEKIFSGRE